jgi:hypothetical protein
MMRAKVVLAASLVVALLMPAWALAHIERASYFPDPRPDNSVHPAAGGKVPKIRSLASALLTSPPGVTRVVCKRDSMARLHRDIVGARRGYSLRPTDHRRLSARAARRLVKINRALFARCRYHSIQRAVTASHNNDRVVVMPGYYTEPASRRAKKNDPKCAKPPYTQGNDRGETGAVSYLYQWHCPNDQNLIAVMGRAPGKGKDPQPPREDRHGIPNLGPCVRCNFQLEGSGPAPDDVVVEAGRIQSRDHGPIGDVKDVGIRGDRADGFVLRNMKVRHAGEHDVYILESDGYVFDRIKTFYAGEYGILTFVEDHGLMQNCEAAGNGDSGVYPGAGADTEDHIWPGDHPRFSQEIRNCDSHHNAGGYSGTDGNAVHVHDNNFYDNALGFTTDVFTATGHPGYPQRGDLIEHNNFYSNNFNPYANGSDVKPSIPVPVGTGLWIAGGNRDTVRNNHFYDNWRRGTMLFAVPDSTVCTPPKHQAGCDPSKVSTSFDDHFYGNVMGVAPNGAVRPNGHNVALNYADFWWDDFAGNKGNCWYGNKPAPGKSITTSPPTGLPDCAGGKDPSSSMGTSYPPNENELGDCLVDFTVTHTPACTWFTTPSRPTG